MKFQIRHEIRGRMRIHVIQSRMSFAQADTLQYYLEQCESVISAKIQNRTEDVTICYEGNRDAILEVLKAFSYEKTDADMLVILTSVDKVCLNYGKEDEVKLDTLSLADAKKYLAAGEFGEGTMAPKIEAAIDFIGESAIRSVLVTKLNKEAGEITGGMGTLIKK